MTATSSRNALVTLCFALLVFLQGLVSPVSAQTTGAPAEVPEGVQVVVVRIEGAISVETVALVKRALRLAESRGAGWVVLEIISRGGIGSTSEEVARLLPVLRSSPVQIVSFVRGSLYGGDLEVALASSVTYMTPGSELGPRHLDQYDLDTLDGEEIRQKVVETISRLEASMARRGPLTEAMKILLHGMVDPDLQLFEVNYEDKSGVDVTRVLDEAGVRSLVLEKRTIHHKAELGQPPLSLNASEGLRWGFSASTVDTLEELVRDEFNVPGDAVYRIAPTWSESSASWLEGMKPILFLLGFILLLIEMKTPGLIIPGVLGVLLIGLGLYSSYLTGLAEWTEIGLFALGLCGIAVEIFVMPGTIVFGALGFLSVLAALVLSQQAFLWPGDAAEHAVFATNIQSLVGLIVSVMIGLVLFWRFMPKLPFFSRVLLRPPSLQLSGASTRFTDERASQPSELIGKTGRASTDLRPAGILELGDDRLDVVTTGQFVSAGEAVRILEIKGNRIIVEKIENSESGEVGLAVLLFMVVFGLLLAVAEVFFFSLGILGTASAVALISAIVLAFMHHGEAWGFAFLGTSAVAAPGVVVASLKLLPRTAFGRKLLLIGPKHEDVASAANEPGLEAFLHKRGATASSLRPAGIAVIDGQRVDVISRGEMLDKDQPIKVIEVEGNRVVVALDREHTS